MKMRVNLSDLRKLNEQLFSHLEEKGHNDVEVSVDFYWDIPKGNRYDPYRKPEDLNLGQLSCDWKELQRIMKGESEPLGYALVWISSLLRAIGEEIVD